MKKLRSHQIGVENGDVLLFSDYADGGEMWTGSGQRERRLSVSFSEAFSAVPTVQLSPSLWDLDTNTIMRAEIVPQNVSPTGFDLVFRTWGDTRVARMRVAWMAIGPLRTDDDWDVA